MIYAQFDFKDKQYIKYTLSGHAESGPYGHDLVCSAVSALTLGTANNITRLADIKPDIVMNEEEGGYFELTLPLISNESKQHTVQILLASLFYSLSYIEESYGEYISVSKNDILN